jgi:hypothetical protein
MLVFQAHGAVAKQRKLVLEKARELRSVSDSQENVFLSSQKGDCVPPTCSGDAKVRLRTLELPLFPQQLFSALFWWFCNGYATCLPSHGCSWRQGLCPQRLTYRFGCAVGATAASASDNSRN